MARNPVIPHLDFILGTREQGIYLSRQNDLGYMQNFWIPSLDPKSNDPGTDKPTSELFTGRGLYKPSFVKSFVYKRLFRNYGAGTWTLELFDPTFTLLEWMDIFFASTDILGQYSASASGQSARRSMMYPPSTTSNVSGASSADTTPIGIVEFRFGYSFDGGKSGDEDNSRLSDWVRGYILKIAPKINKAGVTLTLEGIDFAITSLTTRVSFHAVDWSTGADGAILIEPDIAYWGSMTFDQFMRDTAASAAPTGQNQYNLVYNPAQLQTTLSTMSVSDFPDYCAGGTASDGTANMTNLSPYIKNGNLYLPEFLNLMTAYLRTQKNIQCQVRIGSAPPDRDAFSINWNTDAGTAVALNSVDVENPNLVYIWIDDLSTTSRSSGVSDKYLRTSGGKIARDDQGNPILNTTPPSADKPVVPRFTIFSTKDRNNVANESNVVSFDAEINPVPPAMFGAASAFGISVNPLTFDEVTVSQEIRDNPAGITIAGAGETVKPALDGSDTTKALYTQQSTGQYIGYSPSGVQAAIRNRQLYYSGFPLQASMTVAFPNPSVAPWEYIEIDVATPRPRKFFTSGFYMVTDITYSIGVGKFEGVFKMFKTSVPADEDAGSAGIRISVMPTIL